MQIRFSTIQEFVSTNAIECQSEPLNLIFLSHHTDCIGGGKLLWEKYPRAKQNISIPFMIATSSALDSFNIQKTVTLTSLHFSDSLL